jgi:hypothetical protein
MNKTPYEKIAAEKAILEQENKKLRAKLELIQPLDIQVERIRIASNEIAYNTKTSKNISEIIDKVKALCKKMDTKISHYKQVHRSPQAQSLEEGGTYVIEVDSTITEEMRRTMLQGLEEDTKGRDIKFLILDQGIKIYMGES